MKALVLNAEWDPRDEYTVSQAEKDNRKPNDASSVWKNPELKIEQHERPTPDPDEVVVRTHYAGICGSDISMFETDDDGYIHYAAPASFPNILGHEFSGEVVETGSDTRIFTEGDLVTAEVTDYCARCENCRNGFFGHCENAEQLGFSMNGGFAEFVAVPEKLLWDVSSLLDVYQSRDDALKAAATIEPTTISYHGLFGRAEGTRPGDYYAFHGIGPIGITGMNLARSAGAGSVLAFDLSDERREIARSLGFENVFNPTEVSPQEVISEITDGDGIDVHVEAAGAVTQTYPVIEDTLSEAANVVHISIAGQSAPVNLGKYQGKSAQIYGSAGHRGERVYTNVIRLMAAGSLDNLPIITSSFELDDGNEAFEQAAKRVDGKVIFEM